MPSNSYVYDGVHQLLSAGIPVVDAVEVEGRWVRTHIPAEIPVTAYRKHPLSTRKRVRTSTIPLTKHKFITAEDQAGRKIR